MYCSNCGKEIEDGKGFCPHCGISMSQEDEAGIKRIKMTKLGISISSLAAIAYLSGLISFIVMVLIGAYVLMHEEDQWLKRNVLKGIFFIALIAALRAVIGSADSLVSAINTLANGVKAGSGKLRIPLNLISILTYILSIIERLGLVIFAFKAFKGNEAKIAVVDNYVNKSL